MHHKIDIHPIPEHPIYINELNLAGCYYPYELKKEVEQALTGKTVAQGGILPDDNVRIYIPLDINEEYILFRLHSTYGRLGPVSEENESEYSAEVNRIISQLEIYDQIMIVRDLKNAVNFAKPDEVNKLHSQKGIIVAGKMVHYMEDHEGTAESFPYDVVEDLKREFGV